METFNNRSIHYLGTHQDKSRMATEYDVVGLGFLIESKTFQFLLKKLSMKSTVGLGIFIFGFILIYSILKPQLSNVALLLYSISQTQYHLRRSGSKIVKLISIFWLVYSADIVIEAYYARDQFTLMRYVKLILVHACFTSKFRVFKLIEEKFLSNQVEQVEEKNVEKKKSLYFY